MDYTLKNIDSELYWLIKAHAVNRRMTIKDLILFLIKKDMEAFTKEYVIEYKREG